MATSHLIVDDFLPEAIASQLLDEILAAAPNFAPSLIGKGSSAEENIQVRSSRRLPGRIGVNLDPFRAAIHARFDALCAGTGIPSFPVYHNECSIVAHGDGDYYHTHIDTRTDGADSNPEYFRLLSCVYYMQQLPARFSGGELVIHNPLGQSPGVSIAPQHNRLVAFPAFVPHEVLAVSCPSGAFADSRFSINCWLHRQRGVQR
jgi:SM-20-related protein